MTCGGLWNNVSNPLYVQIRAGVNIKPVLAFISLAKKPKESETLTVVSDDATPKPALKANLTGEYVAHKVKIVPPNANLNSATTQEDVSTLPPSGLLAGGGLQGDLSATKPLPVSSPLVGGLQGDLSAAKPSPVSNPLGPQQPQKNYGIGPSFLLVPKRRGFHNVRSNVKAIMPGRLPHLFPYLFKSQGSVLDAWKVKRPGI